ncbi:MAG: dihydropteroate synthase [Euryarchaeota archaeon RBG_19FT_COMBO_56_21]|nr:MAG: dihydropteroate synthase [Euryarchaeota archaeon RBG_19FT_COMBO_56_21]
MLRFDRPKVMGIVNNTPDSFSGDGLGGDCALAIERGKAMLEAGAAVVDIGGESTRPGADPVPLELEKKRTVPVVEALSASYPGRISIDTMKPDVAQAALLAGAVMVNDVTGLRNPRMIDVVVEHDAAVVIMHMLAGPKTMQVRPRYKDVVKDIAAFLEDRVAAAERAGVGARKIMVDPGIGFGKNLNHNLEVLARLRELKSIGKPVVIGVSRKSFIGRITGMPPGERLEGSLAAAVLAVREGADMVRVHDVPETIRALDVADAILVESRKRAKSQGI